MVVLVVRTQERYVVIVDVGGSGERADAVNRSYADVRDDDIKPLWPMFVVEREGA